MDEDSDLDKELDNSLADLHHGLDSSVDENSLSCGLNKSGLDKSDFTTLNKSLSKDTNHEETMADDQMNMLQDMVVEMKQGFQSALEELAKIQDKEEGDVNHSKKLQQQQQRQLDDLTETIHEIKNQLSTLNKSMEQIKNEQKNLKESLEEVRSNRGSSQDSKTRSEEDRPDLVEEFSAPTEEWNTKVPETPSEDDDQNSSDNLPNGADNEVTALACKSLSLTQALGEKCLNLNLSESSEDEEEEPAGGRRVSHYTPKTSQLLTESTANRRHTMPAQPTPPGRNRDIGTAANRQKAVKELADSERDYCSRLWSLLHTYLTPLQTAGFLSARELGVLFPPYLDQLYAEHCHICTGLQDRLVHWTYMGTIADLLSRVTDSHSDSLMSLYKEYAEDLPSAVTCLRRALSQSSEFKAFLKAIKHSSCQSEELMSLVMAPVQHIPRYLLHLQQVARYTPPTHPDYPLLQTSLHRLRTFVDQLNEEVSNTIHTLNHDGSPGDSGHGLSARDSGVHSNSTEDETVTSARAFSKIDGGHVMPEWLEDPYYDPHTHQIDDTYLRQRPLRPSVAHLNTLSQPDLTIYKNLSSHTSDPRQLSHIPRSQSSLPTGGIEDGGDNTRGRQHRRYKVKKRHQSPVGYATNTQDHSHRNLSPRIRPSSAIDFHSHAQHQFHPNLYRDPPLHARGYQYPGPQPRPHSALGPHVMDPHHKPTIISRKHMRRSQPPLPTSKSYWAESSSSAAPRAGTGYLRGPLSTHDLLPARSAHFHSAEIIDYEDDEDDTRASDTHSLGTSGSHQPNSSQCSTEDRDLDLDLYQGQGLGQSPRNPQILSRSGEFSAAEVTASLARKLCSDHGTSERNEDDVVLRHTNKTGSKSKIVPTVGEQFSSSKPLPREDIEAGNVKEVHAVARVLKEEEGLVSSSAVASTNSHHEGHEHGGLNKAMSSSREKVSNLIKTISNSAKSECSMDGDGGEVDSHTFNGTDETKHVSENNRQFLLSLSNRSSGRNSSDMAVASQKGDTNSNTPVDQKHEIQSGNLANIMNKNGHKEANVEVHTSLSSDSKSAKDSSLLNAPLRNSKTSPQTGPTTVMNGSVGVSPERHQPLFSRLSQPLPFHGAESKTGNPRMSLDVAKTSSPLGLSPKDKSQVVSTGDQPHTSILSASSADTSVNSKIISTSLDSRSNPLFTSSIKSSGNKSMTVQPLETAIDSPRGDKGQGHRNYNQGQGQLRGHDDLSSYPDHNELPPLEVADLDVEAEAGGGGGIEVVRKRDGRKKGKEDRKSYPSDNLPKANDDPVGARKKMHFKASIKNLFTKKKGRVILDDVEREVVMEMATAAAAAATNSASAKSTSAAISPKNAFSKKKKPGPLGSLLSHDSCVHGKNQDNSAFEIKIRRDQGSSTSSPVKVSKRFYFSTKREQPSRSSKDSRELTTAELVQFQDHQTILDNLRAYNKRHGIVFENQDACFAAAGTDTDQTHNQSSRACLQSKDASAVENMCSNEKLLVQQKKQERAVLSKENATASGEQKSSFDNDKISLAMSCKSPSDQRDLTENKKLQSNRLDLLKSVPQEFARDKTKSEGDHRNSKEVNEQIGLQLGNQNGRNKYDRRYNDRKSEFSQKLPTTSVTLCQQCQACETKLQDRLVLKGKMKKDEHRHSENVMENHGSNESDKNFRSSADFSRKSAACPDCKCSNGNKMSDTSTIQRNVLLNDLNDGKKPLLNEKVMLFPQADESPDPSLTDCLKPCADAILLYETSKNNKMTNSYPVTSKDFRRKHKRSEQKFNPFALSPVQEQRTPLKNSDSSPSSSASELSQRNPPQTSKFSLNIFNGSKKQENGKQKTPSQTSVHSKWFGGRSQNLNQSNLTDSKSHPAENKMVMAVTSGIVVPSASETVNVRKIHNFLPSSTNASSDLDRELKVSSTVASWPNQNTANMVSNSSANLRLSQTSPLSNGEKKLPESMLSAVYKGVLKNPTSIEHTVGDDQSDETLVKCYVVEDKDYFEHRYRLYYDDEANGHQNHGTPSAADKIIISGPLASSSPNETAETPRQSPGHKSLIDTNQELNGNMGLKNSRTSPSQKTMESLLKSRNGHDFHSRNSFPDGNLIKPYRPGHPAALGGSTYETSCHGNALLSVCNSQPFSHLPHYKPVQNDLTLTNHGAQDTEVKGQSETNFRKKLSSDCDSTDRQTDFQINACSENSKDTKPFYIPVFGKINDDTKLKLYSLNDSENTILKSHSDTVTSCSGSGTNMVSSPHGSSPTDESNSYKPKNSQQALSSHASHNTEAPPPTREGKYQSKAHPMISAANGQVTQHLASSLPQTFSDSVATSSWTVPSSHSSVPPLLQPGKNGYSPNNHQLLPAEGYACSKPSHSPFQEGNGGILRTSSPYDFFSILPYKEYVISRANSDSGTLIPSDADSRSTPNSTKSASKNSSEKHDKDKKSSRSKKGKHFCEKDGLNHTNLNNSSDSYNGLPPYVNYEVKPKHSNRSKGHFQEDGVILRAHDPNFHLPRHSRYSAESNPLIADAFLQKMAYLPQYSSRPLSHPHVDGSHLRSSKSSSRHTTAHAELSRKSRGQQISESVTEHGRHSSRNVRSNGHSARNSPAVCIVNCSIPRAEASPTSQDDHLSRDAAGATSSGMVQTSPDLLPVNDGLKEDSSNKEKSSSAKKAQSFFSRLAQSPMSFFNRDSKSSNPPK